MFIASYFEYYPKNKSFLYKHQEQVGTYKQWVDKLRSRVEADEIRDLIIWKTETFYRIEKEVLKK